MTYVPVIPPELLVAPNRLADDLGTTRPIQLFRRAASPGVDRSSSRTEMGCPTRQPAFVPTNRLDLSKWHPDFVPMYFYKMFGYPTGVGCLIARKTALAKLSRPWFAGGTILFASVQAEDHILAEGEAAF